MGIADSPTGHDFPTHIRFVIAIGILQEKETRRLAHDQSSFGKDQAGGDVQPLREHGKLVRPTIAVCVLANPDPIRAHTVRLHAVRIVARLRDPTPTAVIPSQRDRFADLRFAGEQLNPAICGDLDPFHGSFGGVGELVSDRFGALLVVGHFWARLPLFWLPARQELLPLAPSLIAHGPNDGVAQQLLELCVLPSPLIVTAGGIEDPAFPLGPGPSPRFPVLALDPFHQEVAALGIDLIVDIGFVPRGILGNPFQDRVIPVHDRGLEDPGFVRFEPTADQGDESRIVAEAGGRTVDRQKAMAALDEGGQGAKLLRRDLPVVRVEQERIVERQRLRVQAGGRGGVVKVNRLPPHRVHEDWDVSGRVVVLALVSQKEHPEGARSRRLDGVRKGGAAGEQANDPGTGVHDSVQPTPEIGRTATPEQDEFWEVLAMAGVAPPEGRHSCRPTVDVASPGRAMMRRRPLWNH